MKKSLSQLSPPISPDCKIATEEDQHNLHLDAPVAAMVEGGSEHSIVVEAATEEGSVKSGQELVYTDRTITWLPVASLRPNAVNASVFTHSLSTEGIAALVEDIRVRTLQQPIRVRRRDNAIIDGERRWLAHGVLGWEMIPCYLEDGADEQEDLEDQLISSYTSARDATYEERANLFRLIQKRLALTRGQQRGQPKKSVGIPPNTLTAEEIGDLAAKATGLVCFDRAKRVVKIFKDGSGTLKASVNAGEMAIDKAYQQVMSAVKKVTTPATPATSSAGAVSSRRSSRLKPKQVAIEAAPEPTSDATADALTDTVMDSTTDAATDTMDETTDSTTDETTDEESDPDPTAAPKTMVFEFDEDALEERHSAAAALAVPVDHVNFAAWFADVEDPEEIVKTLAGPLCTALLELAKLDHSKGCAWAERIGETLEKILLDTRPSGR